MSMFSSFTQFLPSAIQNSITPHASATVVEERPPPESSFDPTNTDDEGDEEDLIRQQSRRMDDERVKLKKEKDGSKMVSETFIFVRPPPSKTNHPLNLQVQLVPPSARPPSGVAVPDSRPTTPTSASSIVSSTTDGSALARTSSNRSEYSSTYASNSTTSFASYASSSAETTSSTSTSSGRSARRIIPLYNLQAHNVLPNVIADAGTDAKIAKFQKKGLELIDLAVLEPVEVWGTRNKTGEKQAKKQGMRISVDEMGTIVHTGIACRQPPNTASRAGFLLPKASGSRPGTPSANSSAVSLASTNFSGQHQVTASPRSRLRELAPPASAPPQSGAFPSSQLPKPSKPIAITPPAAKEEYFPPEATPPAIVVSTTPTKKASSSSLFGKLKFNSKRSSALNPLAGSPSPTSPPASPKPPIQAQQSELAKMALTTSSPAVPTTQGRPASLSVPLSPSPMSPQNSDTPTPTQAAPSSQRDREDEDPAYDTPMSSPARPAFANESGGAQQRLSSIGGAFSRGRNKLFSGIKGAGTAPLEERPGALNTASSSSSSAQQQPAGGAKGFFNKLAAGITGERGAQQESTAAGNKRSSGIFSLGRDSLARDSVDSSSGAARTTSPFGKMLHHSTSQQYIGSSAASSVNPSPRPSHDASSPNPPPVLTTTAPSVAGSVAAPGTPSQLQTFASAQTPQIQTQQLSLRQLQLRPPVLGIQPTYVSASHSQSQDVSTVNFTVGPNGQPIATVLDEEVQNGGTLSKVESYSSLATEESVTSTSLRKRRSSKTRSNTTGTNSRRTSLNLERDKEGHMVMPSTGASVASSTALSGVTSKEALVQGQGKEKERALMYVWLVAKWLKKRNVPPSRATSEHELGNGGGGVERPRARDLFRDILPGRDKGNGNGDREGKRGSWHAGAAVGLLPNLGGHVQQPSNSSVTIGMHGQPLVLGPLVGGGFEVRFEWKRAKTKSKGKNKGGEDDKRGRKKEKMVGGTPVKRRDMAKEEENAVDDTPKTAQGTQGGDRPNRASTISIGSLTGAGRVEDSPSRPGSAGSTSQRSSGAASGSRRRVSLLLKRKKEEGLDDEADEDEDEDDSDSEDSETPWVCTLKIRRIGYVQAPGGTATVVDAAVASAPPPSVVGLNEEPVSGSGTASGKGEKGEKEQTLRLKVGTLSPTPHHPKVVAMLKVPFPLPDVEVERMKFVKRKGAPGEEGSGQNDPYYGLTLTAEDIKDIVCSTGLWLVVRESIGGVGKVNRKGDGWKIRG